jgi:hypothetical protein
LDTVIFLFLSHPAKLDPAFGVAELGVGPFMKFSFTVSPKENLSIDVISYERPVSGDYHDDNWLIVKINVSAGGFSGSATATIQAAELIDFSEQLHSFYDTLTGTAEFSTLEDQLHLTFTGNGKGGVRLSGIVLDAPGIGNSLSFSFDFDQTHLQKSLKELDAVLSAFPVRTI